MQQHNLVWKMHMGTSNIPHVYGHTALHGQQRRPLPAKSASMQPGLMHLLYKGVHGRQTQTQSSAHGMYVQAEHNPSPADPADFSSFSDPAVACAITIFEPGVKWNSQELSPLCSFFVTPSTVTSTAEEPLYTNVVGLSVRLFMVSKISSFSASVLA